jgi:PLP dependent protein
LNTLETRIKHNYDQVLERISSAASRSRRSPAQISVVVVTKKQPLGVIEAAWNIGLRIYGENYPEDVQARIPLLGDFPGIQWHMIGHLQSRKAGIVAKHFDFIHSIDSLRTAEKLDLALEKEDRKIQALLEFNLSGETTKRGWLAKEKEKWGSLLPDITKILNMKHLSIRGLMTMPPFFEDMETNRPFFSMLREFSDFLKSETGYYYWNELSMGTSTDFEIAIEEGATLIRVGTAILGERP